MAKEHGVSMQAAIALCGGCDAQSMSDPAASSMNDQENDIDQSQAQSSDLEDQILPAPLATVPLDWHPFPHLHIYVNDASSVLVALLRPPPSDNV